MEEHAGLDSNDGIMVATLCDHANQHAAAVELDKMRREIIAAAGRQNEMLSRYLDDAAKLDKLVSRYFDAGIAFDEALSSGGAA